VIYNLTAYDVSMVGGQNLYTASRSISNTQSLGAGSDAATFMVASSNVTFTITPQKIGATLYILNCSDSNGWWITGYTVPGIAQEFIDMLSPYFASSSIVVVQNTSQLGQLLNGQPLGNESLQNAIVINTNGEAVPIPQNYASQYSSDYAQYDYLLGQRVNQYNWTWVSMVGYPLYYVTNTLALNGTQNTWGIYGMTAVNSAGFNGFLEGIASQSYAYNNGWITSDVGTLTLTSDALVNCSYYGIFPSPTQTATRAPAQSITTGYNLTLATLVLSPKSSTYPGAIFKHVSTGDTNTTGVLFALGVTRVPDPRLVALGLLQYYKPILYKSEYTASGTSRLVILQLGLAGGYS
jgi:hypothetical protein